MDVSPEKFLGGLVDPLLDGQLERIADCYDEPMLIIRPGGGRKFQDRDTTLAELSAQAATLVDVGAIAGRIADCETRYYGGVFTLVDVHWGFLDRRAHAVAELHETFLLRTAGASWKIAAQILHHEQLARPAA